MKDADIPGFSSTPPPAPVPAPAEPHLPPDDAANWPFTRLKSGSPHSNLYNVSVAFDHDPILMGLAWYDGFLDRVLTGRPVREWRDEDATTWAIYLQDTYGMHAVSPSLIHDLVSQRARAKTKHCVLDWLRTLRWDGVPRLDTAFETYWNAAVNESQPEDYLRAVSRNFFLGLAARVCKPGCQLDTMVVFEGAQGVGKTTALRVLGGDWYALAHESVAKKDFFEALQGKWIIEVGELDSFTRAEVTRVKTVISTPTDRYRASYARSAVDRPRQCVFAGTTNADDWGRDETGLRRFWPVRCGRVQTDRLREMRPQLLAEAYQRVQDGATWWETPESASSVQAERQHEHPWTTHILDWLAMRQETTVTEVLAEAIKLPAAHAKLSNSHDVGRILALAGWQKRNLRRAGRQMKIWTSPQYQETLDGVEASTDVFTA
jgi:predicted P-loop ATPase